MSEKSYRIRANVGEDKVIKTSLTQDIDFLEVLSLKLNQKDTYKLHVSNYGIIVGRVLANDAFGVPNARVSVFIKLTDEDLDISEITNIYPYKTISTTDSENRRYNLLPDDSTDTCYRIVGTFPNKRLVLDNDTEIEIYEKYWKYTTITNQSGDYMIFGVPTGNQTVHIDIDLSDIGILSQKPRDFFYKGYNKEQFDSAEQFREGTDLENLTQLISQNMAVHVYPFFGDKGLDDIAITRCDFKVPYKFEPTCVFIGSIISDKPGQHIGHSCGPSRFVGYNRSMMTGEGTIEMIRKTPNGMVEEFPIKGNRLIDGDGTWCYQIPMNLDYIGTDEFGNIIPVQDSKKGIPTRTSVRFRISLQETITLTSTEHVAKYLVPNIHELHPQENLPMMIKGNTYNQCYEFGSATPKEYFRDLLWNKVYSVKNFIPRFEHRSSMEHFIGRAEKSYMGVRSVNTEHNNNVFPFNNARFHLRFTYRILCLLMTFIVIIIGYYNKLITEVICWKLDVSFKILGKRVRLNFGRPLKFLSTWIKCIGLKGEMFFEERADTYYFPKCDNDCGSVLQSEGLKVNKDPDALIDIVQQTLALEYEIVNLDFYNDWINGVLYLPLWFWKKRAKKKYLFGLFRKKAKNTFCSCDKAFGKLSLSQPCATTYNNGFQPTDVGNDSDRKRHNPTRFRDLKFGVIKEFTNKAGLNVYYYAPGVPYDANYLWNGGPTHYTQLFATDIILLGSLNSCDLDNLPKTFDSLPSSTVNLPFIATFESDESGDGVVTGLDWGHDGGSQTIKYRKGLLMDLQCWNVYTRFKSCVNVGRLSELHVSLDMDLKNEDETEVPIWADGVITEKELVDNETRAKFASMNHNGLTNLVKNVTTNYDTYKFHYIYPINFDGHLNAVKYNYVNGMLERINRESFSFDDIYDSNYVMYRLGEGKDTPSLGRHKKHFYIGSESAFRFPLFNNSFYFYFGLHDGKTAIDKFNTLFNTTCVKKNTYEFTIEYESKAGKWCYNTANTTSDFGTIDIEFNGLSDVFSYSLRNEFNEELISEIDVKSPNLKFGYAIVNGGGEYVVTSGGYKKDGRLRYLKNGEVVKNVFNEPIYLENGVYYLEVTNANGMKVTERINMIQNVLSPNIEEIKLGCKYNQKTSKVEEICGIQDYYGEIKIKSFIIDGEEAFITEMTPYFMDGKTHYYKIGEEIIYPDNYNNITYNGKTYFESGDENEGYFVLIGETQYNAIPYEQPKEASCKVKCSDGSEIYLILEPENDETQDISCFACYGIGDVPSVELEPLGTVSNLDGEITVYTLSFNIWKPGDYVLTSNQICQNMMNDNVSVNSISIENGENFKAFLNGVPFQVINNEQLQSTTHSNWLKLEDPTIYNFKGTKIEDAEFWDEMIDITIDSQNTESSMIQYVSEDSKIAILKAQYQYMAKMCNMLYLTNNQEVTQITITTQGGKEPILIRNIHPYFTLFTDTNTVSDRFVMENKNTLELPLNYPYLIADTQGNVTINNDVYRMGDSVGNYCAVFTNNGGIVSLVNGTEFVDNTLSVESLPQSVDVLDKYSIVQATLLSKLDDNIKNGYLKTMFIDKKLSIDNGLLWGPIHCTYNVDTDPTWKYGRWEFDLNNTLVMAYDENYNIIGDGLSYNVSREHIATQNDDFTLNKLHNGVKVTISLFSASAETLTATTLTELANVVKEKFDDVINNVSFIAGVSDSDSSGGNSYENGYMIYTLNNDIITSSGLTQDINLQLISNLDNNPSKTLYKAVLSIDGEETDIRSQLNFTRSKQNLFLPITGFEINLEMANCKLNEELIVENIIENEEKKYTFKSIVEGTEELNKQFNVGNVVNIQSCAINYSSKQNDEDGYIIWNGTRLNIGENLKKYKTTKYRITPQDNEDNKYFIKQMALSSTVYDKLLKECENNDIIYLYYDNLIQDYLNKYGFTVNIWLKEVTYSSTPNNLTVSYIIYDGTDFGETSGTIQSTSIFGSFNTQNNTNDVGKYFWDYCVLMVNSSYVFIDKGTLEKFISNYEIECYQISGSTAINLPCLRSLFNSSDNKIYYDKIYASLNVDYRNVQLFVYDPNGDKISCKDIKDGKELGNGYTLEYNELDKHWYKFNGSSAYTKYYYSLKITDEVYDGRDDGETSTGSNFNGMCEIIEFEIDSTSGGIKTIECYIYKNGKDDNGLVQYPYIETNKTYMVLSAYTYSSDTTSCTIDGVKYKKYHSQITKVKPSHINDFSCYINIYGNNDEQLISTNSPFLLCGVRKTYEFEKTTKEYKTINSTNKTIQHYFSTTNDKLINITDTTGSGTTRGKKISDNIALYNGKICSNVNGDTVEIDVEQIDVKDFKGKVGYYVGYMKTHNFLKENIQGGNQYYLNCNSRMGIKEILNLNEDDFEYLYNIPVVGDMYCYFDKLLCGTIDENYIFHWNDNYGEHGLFPVAFQEAKFYGRYLCCPNRNGTNVLFDVVGSANTISIADTDFTTNVAENGIMRHLNNLIVSGNVLSQEIIYENSDEYKHTLYVLQTDSISNEIKDGVSILTCSVYKDYYEDNNNLNKKQSVISQSCHINVEPLYFYNSLIVKSDDKSSDNNDESSDNKVVPYIGICPVGINIDIDNALINNQLKWHCEGETFNDVQTIKRNNIYRFICSDGYEEVLDEGDKISIVTPNGTKQCLDVEKFIREERLYANYYIYHIEYVNDVYYEFISQIQEIKLFNQWYLLRVPEKCLNGITTGLTLEFDNKIHYQITLKTVETVKDDKTSIIKILFL